MSIREAWARSSAAPARRWPAPAWSSVAAASAVVVGLASPLAARAASAAAAPDSAADHQLAAAAMAPYEIFDKVLIATTADESARTRRSGDLWTYTPSPVVVGYTAALEALYAAGSAEAAMYAAIIHKRRCRALKADTDGEAPAEAPAGESNCFIAAFEKLRFAANAGDPTAMRQLSESYESGYGLPSSTPEALSLTVGSADAEPDLGMAEQAPTPLPLQKVRLRISSELSGRLR